MYTTCPECGTVFRVTVAVLRTARGQVRCGVCAATFDALLYLSEQVDADDAASEPGPDPGDTASQAALPAQYAASAPDARDGAAARAGSAAGDRRDADRDELVADDAADSLGADLGEFAFDDDTGIEEVEALRTLAARDAALADVASTDRDRTRSGGRAPTDPRSPAPAAEPAFDIDLQFDDSPSPDDVFPVETPAPARRPEHSAIVANAAALDTFPDDVPIEVAAEILVANADSLPPPDFPPFEEPAPMPPLVRPFEQRAGRNSPSADEDRALAQIAAALARGAKGRNGSQAERQDAPDVEILDPWVAEHVLANGDAGPEEIADSALEFNLPAEKWDEVFVADPATPTIPPLDAQLARARDVALAMPPPRGTDAPAADDLDVEIEAIELGGDDDDRELDESDLDDGDLDDADAAALERARAARARPAAADDPLATTDEFPPLRVTPAEEAAAGLAHTPAARRHGAAAERSATHAGERPLPGATPASAPAPDFDALVAAAAARAAADVAARATPTRVGQHVGAHVAQPSAAQPSTPNTVGASLAAPLTPALAGGGALSGESAPPASTPDEAPDWIQFDAKRFQDVARGGAGRAWWATSLLALGIVALALGLGVQVVHHYRDALAQHPVAGPPLRELYARLGLPLEPQWNLAGYELKQWGAATDAEPGTLRVRASVVNRAPRGQPYPLLRVTLEDRFGGRLARREFTPAEYLPGRTPPAQLLAPGARVDADLLIADPGSDAVGFELDVCLPRHGRTVCGTDLARGGG